MKRPLPPLAVALLLVFSLAARTRALETPPEIIHGTDHFEFSYRVTLPELNKAGRLWLPLAKSGPYQNVQVEGISSPMKWRETSDADYGNQILIMNPGPADSGKTIEIKYLVIRREKTAYSAKASDPARFLQPERLVPTNQTFRSMAEKATAGVTTDFEKGRALYDHVLERMKYDKSGTGWGRGDALYACDARTGNCSDFHAYFIALARSIGIPARFAIGMSIPADKDDGTIPGYHCWAEFLAGGRWVPVDISEASKHPDLANYYFGHHPANRFELSAGRDLEVDPSPASGPINFLVYPMLEVDGSPVKTAQEFSFHRIREAVDAQAPR